MVESALFLHSVSVLDIRSFSSSVAACLYFDLPEYLFNSPQVCVSAAAASDRVLNEERFITQSVCVCGVGGVLVVETYLLLTERGERCRLLCDGCRRDSRAPVKSQISHQRKVTAAAWGLTPRGVMCGGE